MSTVLGTLDATEALAKRFRALADPKRLCILELLRDGERCVCELTDELGLGQSLLSFHLRTLKDAGLVRDRRDGRWVFYALDPQAFGALREALGALGAAASGAVNLPGECCG